MADPAHCQARILLTSAADAHLDAVGRHTQL